MLKNIYYYYFSNKSKERQQFRHSEKVRNNAPNEDSVGSAFAQILRSKRHFAAAKVVEQIQKNPAELGPKIKIFLKNENNQPKKWTNLESLAEYFNQDMAVSDFRAFRINVNKSSGFNAVPCWETLHIDKMKLSPDRQFIIQTENSIRCPMQEVSQNYLYILLAF